ncbi:anti-sigma factor antagonist [Pleurocapsales cyanobacterium LEGE 10410]|nr:anti-sigma factor antagonist [Pleurocapsales cyanobacterium LEGE 10410]
MELKIETVEVATVVELTGDVDASTASEVKDKILPLFEAESKMLLDMTNVPYMSSAGLRMLLMLYRQASIQQVKLVLVGLSEEIADIMEVTGFLNLFTTSATIETGLTALY